MNVVDLASHIRLEPVVATAFRSVCESARLNQSTLFDALAKEIAQRFSDGRWSFEDASAAINHLYAFHMTNGTSEPPRFFHQVFLALDDGEHDHGGAAKGADPVELYTKPAIARILAGG